MSREQSTHPLRLVTLHDGRRWETRCGSRAEAIERACNALGCRAGDVARVEVEEVRSVMVEERKGDGR